MLIQASILLSIEETNSNTNKTIKTHSTLHEIQNNINLGQKTQKPKTKLTNKRKGKCVAACARRTAPLQEPACHIGSHRVTCHPVETASPAIIPPVETNCLHMCTTLLSFITNNRTVLMIFPFSLQMNIIALVQSTPCEHWGLMHHRNVVDFGVIQIVCVFVYLNIYFLLILVTCFIFLLLIFYFLLTSPLSFF